MLSARPLALRAQRLPFTLAGRPASRRTLWRKREPQTQLHVKLQPPKPRRRRLLQWVAFAVPVLLYANFVKIEVVKTEDEDALIKQNRAVKDDQTGGEEEEEASGFFLPIWWPYPEGYVPYKGTDPEWLEFAKFARDPKKRSQVTGEYLRAQ
jgi:hypothetical protein